MYTYASNDVVDASELAKQDDPSFEFYDNARGKINLNVLIKLAAKFNIDDNIVSKHENLVRWDELVNEYNAVTNQSFITPKLDLKVSQEKIHPKNR